MGEVIIFPNDKAPMRSYYILVNVYDDGVVGGKIIDYCDNLQPKDLHEVASHLFKLRSCVVGEALSIEPDTDKEILSTITVYSSGRAKAWTSDLVQTQEQVDWVRGLYNLACETIIPVDKDK